MAISIVTFTYVMNGSNIILAIKLCFLGKRILATDGIN